MRSDLVTRGLCYFVGKPVEQADGRIDDAAASGADQVGVGIGLVAVVTVTAIREAYLEDFTDFLEQVDGLVDRGEAGGRKIDFYLIINVFNARVDVGVEKGLKDGDPLRGDAEFALPELFENVIQTLLRIVHRISPINGNKAFLGNDCQQSVTGGRNCQAGSLETVVHGNPNVVGFWRG